MVYDASLPEEKRVTFSYPQIMNPGDDLMASGLFVNTLTDLKSPQFI